MKFILRYLKMPSTWKGLTWMLTLLGVALSPEQREAIGVAGIAIVAAIEMFTDEDKRSREININLPPIEMQGKSQLDVLQAQSAQLRKGADNALRDLRTELRVNVPPDHISGTMHDERRTDGFTDK